MSYFHKTEKHRKMDYSQAKQNMIDSQLRTWDIIDQRVLDTFLLLNRQDFVPSKFKDLSYADVEIPIGFNQTMLTPKLAGRLIQEIEINSSDRILEIGTGTGYLTTILSYLGGDVVSFEINRELHHIASNIMNKHNRGNVRLELGDGLQEVSSQNYDAIVLTGSLPAIPDFIKNKLTRSGRMIGVFGRHPIMSAVLISRRKDGSFDEAKVFETYLSPLTEPDAKPDFIF